MCASMTRTPRSPTTKPLLSTGGLFESRAYTPGASCFVSSRACAGCKGGGINPFGACAEACAKIIRKRSVNAIRVFVVLFINFLLIPFIVFPVKSIVWYVDFVKLSGRSQKRRGQQVFIQDPRAHVARDHERQPSKHFLLEGFLMHSNQNAAHSICQLLDIGNFLGTLPPPEAPLTRNKESLIVSSFL